MASPFRIPLVIAAALLTGCAAAQPITQSPATTSAPAAAPAPEARAPQPADSPPAPVLVDSSAFKRSSQFNLAVLGEEKTCLCCRGAAGEVMAKAIQQLYDNNQFDTLRAMADANVVHAQFILAMAYYRGHGVPRDPQQSLTWLKRAAEKGYGPAQFALGYSYQQGDGVPRDEAQAVQWFGRAAVKGFVRAQMALADCYRFGRGVSVDTAEAKNWYAKIAEGPNCEFGQEARVAMREMR